ncbi:MAG: hypothetical protein KAQ98_08685 [Bacteriovoracaceae bacterium]|nr:hypothetical protein [Bacteriovoracaceae bacterium]
MKILLTIITLVMITSISFANEECRLVCKPYYHPRIGTHMVLCDLLDFEDKIVDTCYPGPDCKNALVKYGCALDAPSNAHWIR